MVWQNRSLIFSYKFLISRASPPSEDSGIHVPDPHFVAPLSLTLGYQGCISAPSQKAWSHREFWRESVLSEQKGVQVQSPWAMCKSGVLEEQGDDVGVGVEVSRTVVGSFRKF